MKHTVTILKRGVLTLMVAIMVVTPFGVRAVPMEDIILENLKLKETVEKAVQKPVGVAIIQILLNLISFVANRLAYDAAVAIAAGGTGQTSNLEYRTPEDYWKDVGNDILGESIGQLGEGLKAIGVNFSVCAPADPNIRLNLQLGIAQKAVRKEPTCDFRAIQSNWEGFVAKHQNQQFGTQDLIREFSSQFAPGQSGLGSAISIVTATAEKANLKADIKTEELFANKGFKAVTDVITGNVKTPSTVLEDQFKSKLNKAQDNQGDALQQALFSNEGALLQIGISAGSTFLNTLLSQLTSKIYSGLFEPPTSGGVFDPDFIDIAGRARARETFKGLLTTPIQTIASYNIVNEFVACPGANMRSPNNCVMDTDFAHIIALAAAGAPMTIQEAIDANLLHGDWPLISSKDKARNQDAFCYTFGYCNANLVKMRVARILPVGLEMAADSPHNNSSAPVTLQEVVDGFNDCNDDAGNLVDGDHPWCRLVDPNWTIKYPETMCKAQVFGQMLVAQNSDIRVQTCVDAPSCIEEDDSGKCVGGFGYCTRERNTWRFGGDSCPSQYASCLTLTSRTGTQESYLTNTVDYGTCNASNVGCQWYKTERTFSTQGTPEPDDDGFVFGNGACDADATNAGEACISDADCQDGACTISYAPLAQGTCDAGTNIGNECLTNADCPGGACAYPVLPPHTAYADMLYLDADAPACDPSADGCTEVVSAASSSLNLARNGSFETVADDATVPTHWAVAIGSGAVVHDDTPGEALYGNKSVLLGTASASGTIVVSNYRIALPVGEAVTFSWYAKAEGANATSNMMLETTPVPFTLTPPPPRYVAGDGCSVTANGFATNAHALTDSWKRFTCSVIFPGVSAQSTILTVGGTNARIDGVMVEYTRVPSAFHEAYAAAAQTTHIKLPPDALGCTGEADDPEECAAYAPLCRVTENNCTAYTPSNGDPTVPGIINETNVCPSECVGYETFRQRATNFESSVFPLYFIAKTAQTCSAQFEGCSEFTNLDAIAEGGESREYFSDLRVCQEIGEAAGTNAAQATYYTWESIEDAGHQLRTWSLKRSNASAAPCTSYEAVSGNCTDAATVVLPDACNEHADIVTNPDCREFYDAAGNIHYRLWSQTITVSDSCNAYRKTESTLAACAGSGGKWNAGAGSCTYNIMPAESTTCPAVQNGCRGYVGNAGNNTRVAYRDLFESGSLARWFNDGGGSVTYSNDSVARDGHSMRLQSGAAASPFALMSPPSGCQPTGDDTTCTLTNAAGLSCDVPASTAPVACGDAVGQFRAGLSYVVSFWARGAGTLEVMLGDDVSASSETVSFGSVTLGAGWQEYTLGPIDPAVLNAALDLNTTTLFFVAPNNAFVDNVTVREAEDTVYRIANSWATPSTCDQSPEGLPAPQLYLGCAAYEDHTGADHTLSSFASLCREEAIGCRAFYDTQNSEGPYGATYRALCYVGNPATAPPVTTPTACEVEGEEVCTVPTGQYACSFTYEGTPVATLFEKDSASQVVPPDQKRYIVDLPQYHCAAEAKGCQVVGLPEFGSRAFAEGPDVRDRHRAFATAYEDTAIINNPDTYNTSLCAEAALFCEAWSTTDNRLQYFRDPSEVLCEFKSSVLLSGTRFDGWFQKGTDTPCYGSYLQNGTRYGIWRNGDPAYAGWAGTCPREQNLCSEFLDVADTQAGAFPDGRTYYFVKNDKITEAGKSATEKCDGLVSQKAGCVAFDDTSVPFRTFNASASYVRSIHADEIDRLAEFSPVSAVDCSNPLDGDGEFTLQNGDEVNLCQRRCAYLVTTGGTFESPVKEIQVGNACLETADCPLVQDVFGAEVAGGCTNVRRNAADILSFVDIRGMCTSGENEGLLCNASVDLLCPGTGVCEAIYAPWSVNDSNTVVKVRRDRTCAEWLSCDSEYTAWSQDQGKFVNVCESVGLCNEYTNVGDSSFCSNWIDRPLETLSDEVYAARDATWYGLEYSGYSIPGQYSVEGYEQINLNPLKWCSDEADTLFNAEGVGTEFDSIAGSWSHGVPMACVTSGADGECGALTIPATQTVLPPIECVPAKPDFRLAVPVGPCLADAQNGDACTVGVCEETGFACSRDSDCGVVGGDCILISAAAKTGICYNGQCTQAIDGAALDPELATQNSCRGYPEESAPFPHEIVTNWDANVDEVSPSLDDRAFTRRTGFNHANVCANGEACECSYKTTEYGDGVRSVYTESEQESFGGVCNGGPHDGAECDDAATDCGGGTCEFKSSEVTHVGWNGYCIQHDLSITILADAEKNACLLWLPVDQLFGSTDLFNKFRTAGFPVENTAYCLDTALYVNLGTSNASAALGEQNYACADSIDGAGHDTPSGDGAGITWSAGTIASACDDGEFDDCWTNARCPVGGQFYAIVGTCDDPLLEPTGACQTGSADTGGARDNCPYICVPLNSYRTEETEDSPAGTACTPPSLPVGLVKEQGTSDLSDAYLVQSLEPYIEDYSTCQRQGALASSMSYLPVFPSSTNCVQCGYSNFNNTDEFYLGCKQLTFTSIEEEAYGGSQLGNAAYTNRLLSPNVNQNYTIQDHPTVAYSRSTAVAPAGRVVPELQVIEDVESPFEDGDWPTGSPSSGPRGDKVLVDLGGSVDRSPVYVAACQNISTGAIFTAPPELTCPTGSDTVTLTPNWARTYGYYEAKIPNLENLDTCTNDADCNQPPAFTAECRNASSDAGELFGCYAVCAGLPSPSLPDITDTNNDGVINGAEGAAWCAENGMGTCKNSTIAPNPHPSMSYCTGRYGAIGANATTVCSAFAADFAGIMPRQAKNTCAGPGSGGKACNVQSDCYSSTCENWSGTRYCTDPDVYVSSPQEVVTTTATVARQALKQFFARMNPAWIFVSDFIDVGIQEIGFTGWYELVGNVVNDYTDDRDDYGTGPNDGEPTPPVVRAVGEICVDDNCLEGAEDALTLNGNTAAVYETEGSFRADLRFFATTDPNQFPLRKVLVDWGDGTDTTAASASTVAAPQHWGRSPLFAAADNYYKAHRGLRIDQTPWCTDDAATTQWGLTSLSCEEGPFRYQHYYRCTQGMLNWINVTGRSCVVLPDGSLQNSPCTFDGGACVFQPRVYVEDNWGYCTGVCDDGLASTSDNPACYGTDTEDALSECFYLDYPLPGASPPAISYSDPWVYYDGYVVLEP